MNQRTWLNQNQLGVGLIIFNLDCSSLSVKETILCWCGKDLKKSKQASKHSIIPTSTRGDSFLLVLCLVSFWAYWEEEPVPVSFSWVEESDLHVRVLCPVTQCSFCYSAWNLKQIVRIFLQFKAFINIDTLWECPHMMTCCSMCLPSCIYGREIVQSGVKHE